MNTLVRRKKSEWKTTDSETYSSRFGDCGKYECDCGDRRSRCCGCCCCCFRWPGGCEGRARVGGSCRVGAVMCSGGSKLYKSTDRLSTGARVGTYGHIGRLSASWERSGCNKRARRALSLGSRARTLSTYAGNPSSGGLGQKALASTASGPEILKLVKTAKLTFKKDQTEVQRALSDLPCPHDTDRGMNAAADDHHVATSDAPICQFCTL